MGRPYPGHRIEVIDDDGHAVADSEIGEVAVNRIAPDGTRDPVFFLEYFGNPEGTAAKFIGDWCRTGDLAKRDADGYLWYQGRADDMRPMTRSCLARRSSRTPETPRSPARAEGRDSTSRCPR